MKFNNLYNNLLLESKSKTLLTDLIRGSGANIESDDKIKKYSDSMKSFRSYGKFPPIKASLNIVDQFDIDEYEEAEEGGYTHELAWNRDLSKKDLGKKYLSIYDGHHRALAAIQNKFPIKYINPSLNEGWFDEDEYQTLKLNLNDLILVKKSIDKSLSDVFSNRKSKTNGEIEVWKIDDKYLIIDGWHRFVESALKNYNLFKVNVVGDGYNNSYRTSFDNDELYSSKEFIETIEEWKDDED